VAPAEDERDNVLNVAPHVEYMGNAPDSATNDESRPRVADSPVMEALSAALRRMVATYRPDACAFDIASAAWGATRLGNRTRVFGSSAVDVILRRFDIPDEVRLEIVARVEGIDR